jgi:hypothetical protein
MVPARKSVLWIMTSHSKLDIGKCVARLDRFWCTIRYFCVQANWRVPSACSDFCVLWKTFMGMRTGILKAIKRDVKRNLSEELHTRVCYCLRERNWNSVKVQNFSSIKTASINFFSVLLFCTMANKCTIFFTNYHTPTCFDTIVSSSGSL